MTRLTSAKGELHMGPSFPTDLINDQLRIMDQSQEILEQLAVNNFKERRQIMNRDNLSVQKVSAS